MVQRMNGLKNQAIISHQEIVSLKQQLKEAYPEYNNMQRAQLFAQFVHEQLDTALAPFKKELQKRLKFTLLRQTIYKEDFCINLYDVIDSYLHLALQDGEGLDQLTCWLNQYQTHTLTCQDVSLILDHFPADYPQVTLTFPDIALKSKIRPICMALILFGTALGLTVSSLMQQAPLVPAQYFTSVVALPLPDIARPLPLDIELCANYLQEDLQYTTINEAALKDWLLKRHSLLAREPYFSAILEAAQEFNVNPLLLFAITGQEQGFVPNTSTAASRIANNPFNVYGSWQQYNPTIHDSARIAAQTLTHLGEGCPENSDQIKWINQSYAADPNWHIGVTYFFHTLTEVAGNH